MKETALNLTFSADSSDWSEDLAWLAESRIHRALDNSAAGCAHAHLHLRKDRIRRTLDGCSYEACTIQLRLGDGDVIAVEALGSTPQGAILLAMRQLRRHIDPNWARTLSGCRPQNSS
jgi:ribosome-associated translation inhibitor RaiA